MISWGHLVGDEVLFSLGKQLAKLTSEQVEAGADRWGRVRHYRRWPVGARLHALAQSILANARTILINHQTPLSISIGVEPGSQAKRRRRLSVKSTRRCTKTQHNGRGRVDGRHLPVRQVEPAARYGSVADTPMASVLCSV